MATKFILTLISRIVPLSVAFFFTIYSDDPQTKIRVYWAAIAILVLGEYVAVYRPIANIRDFRVAMLDHYMKPFVASASYNGQKVHVRVNIMIAKWTFFGRRFFQAYQWGMAGHPDANISISVSKGFCGQAFRSQFHEVQICDLRGKSVDNLRADFKFSRKQAERTLKIKGIACIPLFREVKTLGGSSKTKFFGVLNVDTSDEYGYDFLNDEEIKEQIRGLATFSQLTLRF